MKTSEHINELAAAMAKAQPAFEAAGRDHKARVETKTGSSYEFNYADFAAYLDVCRKPLGDAGLAFVQEAVSSEKEVSVITRLMHASGQWIETEPLRLPLVPDSRGVVTAQIVGSGVTYAKRYSLSSLIGLASEADDDGNQASGNTAETGKREPLPACPKCGHNKAVIKGKAEYGGGFVCWKNKDGCGKQWQPGETESDPEAKAKADAIASEHGMTTADQLPAPDTTAYDIAIKKLPAADSILKVSTLLNKVKDWRIANQIDPKQYIELNRKLARRAVEVCATEEAFASCEKIIRDMHLDMRLSEGDWLEIGGVFADAKDAKLGAVA